MRRLLGEFAFMKRHKATLRILVSLCALFACVGFLAGCKTFKYSLDHEGVYVLAYDPTNIPIGNVDVDDIRFRLEKHSFDTNEQPAALIVGKSTLRNAEVGLLDLTTGKTVATKKVPLLLDYAVLQPLQFSQSGNYEIYVGRPHAVRASCHFFVNCATNAPGVGTTNRFQASALSERWIRLDLNPKKSWKNYDRAFLATLDKRWQLLVEKDTAHTNYNGIVVVAFKLHSNGQISDMQLKTNTVSAQAAAICQRAILDLAPYPAWPEAMRKRIGKDSRNVDFTFNYCYWACFEKTDDDVGVIWLVVLVFEVNG
jgi:hypothetical protein